MSKVKHLFAIILLISFSSLSAQENEEENTTSNIQNYTPSKLLEIGKWDIKWFNNLYTESKNEFNSIEATIPRQNFFNSSIEVFTGITDSKWLNVGVIAEFRSNTFAGSDALSVFKFENKQGVARSGLGHIAPSVKIAPFKKISNLSLQSSFYIPTHDKESDANGYLAEKSFIWQNRIFYDQKLGDKFQVFTEIGARWFMGDTAEGYANNSIDIAPGVFFSYFPTPKFTVLTFAQHAQLLSVSNNYERNYTALGGGAKYQLTKTLNAEVLYSNFVRGDDTGLGQSFNFGLRAIF